MNKIRWAALAAIAMLASAGLFLATACDPCASCSGEASPSATPTTSANACLPSSSLGILVRGKDATVYVPQGFWEGGTTGINVVPIETSSGIGTGAAPKNIATANIPNSCSSNSKTGETVCVGNNTDVYLINGSTLTSTLTSGSTGQQSFTGGLCNNCGVVVDSTTNRALIAMGLDVAGSGGFQFLDLGGTPKFETAFAAGAITSEDVSIDPIRHLILSPNEQANYQIVNISTSTPALFNNDFSGENVSDPDSAAEDCTTGIALSTDEFTTNLFIADLTQAVFTPGSPGTWTDTAEQVQDFPEFANMEAGTCGIAVAPGTHLGVVTGEFGGNLEGVIQLPATSGTGVPAVTDWVAFNMPLTPDEAEWGEGNDPHTVTAYVSPNSKKALAVLENSAFTFLAVIDLQALLSAPRTPEGHVAVDPLPAGIITYISEVPPA
jgi:hypothetical protein